MKRKMKKKYRIVIAILIIAAAICCGIYIYEYYTAQKEIAGYTEIQSKYSSVAYGEITGWIEGGAASETDGLPYTLVAWDDLLTQNPQTVGWIAIPNSLINYPVVQANDNSKYLRTSFIGEKSRTGTVFMDKDNNAEDLDQNTVLYGHNMGSGRADMFGTLLYYKEQAHYDTHRYVQFDTVYEQHGWWKVFAVINHDLSNGDFNYLRLQFGSEDEFMDWVARAQALSMYDSDVEIKADDRILILSTCDSALFGKRGRLLIMAVKC